MPAVYRIKLDYYNSYHDFKLRMDGKLYSFRDGSWVEVEGEEIDPDKPFILFFERVFTHYMRKLTFNDIVTADEYELEVYRYESEGDGLISIHKVDWERPVPPVTYYHIYRFYNGEEMFGKYDEDFLAKFVSEHRISFDI